ncbi:MAG: helix-turn-helix transcriptional regulator [Deinococcales bacterium]|nr:helix-turn-helix transcriptional regulator [Chitinophagaceae bacterium]
MKFQRRVNKWLIDIKKYLILYSNGYYTVPYLSNSPDVMIDSLKTMPFTKHNRSKKVIYTHNIFTDGALYYREISEGLWVIVTEIAFLKAVATKALYDNEPCDYYFLTHFRYNAKVGINTVNAVELPKFGWSLYKPGSEISSYFNAGDAGVFVNIVFTKAWAYQNIALNHLLEANTLKDFFIAKKSYIVWDDIVPNAAVMTKELLITLKENTVENTNHLSLTIQCLAFMLGFLKGASNINLQFIADIKEVDRRHLSTAEKLIINNLSSAFPGIDAISQQVHMSPTKLKTLFKIVYGNTLLQYYQEKQMLFALELLQGSNHSVKDVAAMLSYENTSNFTLAFKKYHQYLPSEVLPLNSTNQ